MLPIIIDPQRKPEDMTIVVAMSGGIDSATVAVMLKKQGYNVIGVTLQLYPNQDFEGKKGACCAGKDIEDARIVANQFDFPHYVLDYEALFKKEVIDDFVESYTKGETPIPCIKCNQTVKFRDLFRVAKELGADALATGHYAQRKMGNKGPELHRAIDKNKDQSYFLFGTTQDQLSYIHFPLGEYSKEETRNFAQSLGIMIAEKPDSQDICFVQNGSYSKLIAKLRPNVMHKGKIIHIDGTTLGEHEGIIHFTVGQRKGLKIAYSEPLYVIKIDANHHNVIVGPKSALGCAQFKVHNINWLDESDSITRNPYLYIQIRSAHNPIKARLTSDIDGLFHVIPEVPQHNVSPGQACVFYQLDGRVLGGGWISREE